MTQSIVVESIDSLRAAANDMADVAEAVSRAMTTLHRTLTQLGDPIRVHENVYAAPEVTAGTTDNPPWGTDSYGKSFATGTNGYLGMSVGLLQGGFDTAHTLFEFARGMSRAAGELNRTETESSEAFRRRRPSG